MMESPTMEFKDQKRFETNSHDIEFQNHNKNSKNFKYRLEYEHVSH